MLKQGTNPVWSNALVTPSEIISLTEIGDISPAMQSRSAWVLRERVFEPLGKASVMVNAEPCCGCGAWVEVCPN